MSYFSNDDYRTSALLSRMTICFVVCLVFHTAILTPLFSAITDTGSEDITKAIALADKQVTEEVNFDNIQSQLIEGALTVKRSLSKRMYLFLYVSQVTYNLICFAIPGFLVLYLFRRSFRYENIYWKPQIAHIILLPLLVMVSLPMISETIKLNEAIGINYLLDQLGWNLNEDSVKNMVFGYAVFFPETDSELLLSLIGVALVPAIGEELFFRGALQQIIGKSMDIHTAIFLTALIFSAFHLDISAFFYRFFLGVLLGYLFYWTSSIFIPMIVHALNNSLSVVVMYFTSDLQQIAGSSENMDGEIGFTNLLFVTLIAAGLLFFYFKTGKHQQLRTSSE